MKIDVSKFTINDAKKKVAESFSEDMEISKKYFDGDHWQDGDGWVGPAPSANETDRSTVMSKIETAFVSKNVVKEVVERHRDAVLGREIDWHLKLADSDLNVEDNTSEDKDKEKQINEIEFVLKSWWQEKEVFKYITHAVDSLLYSGKGYIRIFIPSGRLDNGVLPNAIDLKEALKYIHVESPDPDGATVLVDTSMMNRIGIYTWSEKINDKNVDFAEISYVDDINPENPITVIRKISSDKSIEPDVTIQHELGGITILYELSSDPLIGPQVHENQAALNMAMTMLSRNIVVAGFLERILINAQMPGTYKTVGGERKFVPDELNVGAGITTSLVGITDTDDDGNKKRATPSVIYRDPVEVNTFIESKRENYKNILEQVHQSHMILAESALASGESRIQARADFSVSIYKTKPIVDLSVQWLINTVLTMASFIESSNSEKYIGYTVNCDVKPNSGPLTPDEKRVVIDQYKYGLIARETAMILLGINDPVAEKILIDSEKKVITPEQRSMLLTALSKVGYKLTIEQMAEIDENDLLFEHIRTEAEFLSQLEKIAEIETSKVGSPAGSINSENSDKPGPAANLSE